MLVFGNPQLGTPVLQDDIRAGLMLPLRVLVHNDQGQTIMVYETVDSLFEDLDVDPKAEYRAKIAGALEKLTTIAAE